MTVHGSDRSAAGDRRPRRLRRPKRWSERNRRERGIALVWMALTLLVMVLFAGFAVDVSNWYLQAERLQRAADAGAHAGVIFLPGDLPSATTTAKSTVSKNGYTTGGSANTTVTVTQEPNPNRLRVKISTDVPTFFVSLVGIDDVRMTREAVAEYIAPVPMGSPQNKLGNDPDGADPGTQLWVNISGPQTGKEQGDRYQSKICSTGTYGCSGTTNNEYATDGYFYALDVTSKGTGDLNFDVYDAAWVNTGFGCENYMPTSDQITGRNGFVALTTRFPDAATRYGSARYCSGDGHPGSSSASAVSTTFRFLRPDNTPWNNTDNLPVPSCPPLTIPGYNPAYAPNGWSSSNAIYNWLMNDPSFAQTFHRWRTLCTVPNGSVEIGKYIVQVRTNVTAAAPTAYNSSVSTQGHNHMSFRTGFGTAGTAALDGSKVTLTALGRLPIFANASGADTRFYLARVLPTDAGRTLRINLFDMGEGSQPGTLQILPPAEYASTFSNCSISRDDNASLSVNRSTCTLSNVSSSSYNGRLLTIDVPIPKTYTCDTSQVTGCWIKIKAIYPSGATVTDATTWSAAILGSPIRIVE